MTRSPWIDSNVQSRGSSSEVRMRDYVADPRPRVPIPRPPSPDLRAVASCSALSAGGAAAVAAASPAARDRDRRPDRNRRRRRVRVPGNRARPPVLRRPRASRPENGHASHAQDRSVPRRRAAPEARRAPRPRPRWIAARSSSARASSPAPGAFASQLPVRRDPAGEGREVRRRQARDGGPPHDLHALLGRLRGRRGGRERRVGAPGAGVRLADQPRRALREGRVDPRARPRRAPPQDADEAGRRQVACA